jgi:hypothetical protein
VPRPAPHRRRTFLSQFVFAKDILVWKFFFGACVLTAALLQPHAPARSIVGGMGLAALVMWAWAVAGRRRTRAESLDKTNQNRSGREG